MKPSTLAAALAALASVSVFAGDKDADKAEKVATVEMHAVNEQGVGENLGQVVVRETEDGLVFEPTLNGLPPGMHGFHVHQNASCEPSKKDGKVTPAGTAGGHYDPKDAGQHGAPWGNGHLGDLPALYVDQDGTATRPVFSPRLREDDLKGRALMIHAGGDNYSDEPKPLGGGGARVACGVIEK